MKDEVWRIQESELRRTGSPATSLSKLFDFQQGICNLPYSKRFGLYSGFTILQKVIAGTETFCYFLSYKGISVINIRYLSVLQKSYAACKYANGSNILYPYDYYTLDS